jgi:hypothetical protein
MAINVSVLRRRWTVHLGLLDYGIINFCHSSGRTGGFLPEITANGTSLVMAKSGKLVI